MKKIRSNKNDLLNYFIYDKKDLIHHFKDKFIVCRKCISEYQQLYGVK